MKKYHLVLSDGSERDVRAEDANIVEGGALVFMNANAEPVIAYAHGSWRLCEVEARDDR